jgi:uncharacterized protein (DUF1697 family)
MTTFVALLRGINVSGQKTVRMADLRKSCARLGLENVRTYLQSGNIAFSASGKTAQKLAAGIRTQIAKDFGHDVEVLVLSATTLNRVANSNPLRPPSGDQQRLYHATFLSKPVAASRFRKLALPVRPGEKAVLAGQVVWLYCPHGYGTTKLNNSYFERTLVVTATTRNWRTVLALRDLCAAQ